MAKGRAALVREMQHASAKLDEWRAAANRREAVFLKRKTPKASATAERAWLSAERTLGAWGDKLRKASAQMAKLDARERERERARSGVKPRGGVWRYHAKFSSW